MTNPQRSPIRADALAAVVLTGILSLAVVSAIHLTAPDPAYLRNTFTPEHIVHLGMFDSRGQQWAHRILILLIAVLAAGLAFLRPVDIRRPLPMRISAAASTVANYGGLLIGLVVFAHWILTLENAPMSTWYAFQGGYPLRVLLSPVAYVSLLGVGLLALLLYDRFFHKPRSYAIAARRIALASLGIYVAALIYVGIAERPDLSGFPPSLLAGVEWHYSGSVGPADRLAAGQRLGEVSIHSGLLPSVLAGIWQQRFGMLDFGAHIRLIAVLQIFALAAAIIGYGAWYSWKATSWMLAALLALPWMLPLHAAVLYPNQSAWRFLAFCVGVVLLTLLYARPLRVLAPVLGFAGGIAILWNPETGLCLSFGYLVHLALRAGEPARRSIPAVMLHFIVGMIAAFAGFLALVRVGLGYWLDPITLLKAYPLVGSFARGYGGLPFSQIDPLAALVFLYALYTLLRGLLDWGRAAAPEPRAQCTSALACVLILWSAYYFKAPDPWNLWSFLFLFGFLVGSLLPRSEAGGHHAWWRPVAYPAGAALALVVIPAVVAMNAVALRSLQLAPRAASCPPENVVSGVCLSSAISNDLTRKADALREHFNPGSLLYFSSNSYLMPLMTGVVQPLRERDPYSETILKSDFDRLVKGVLTARPACLLFDDPKSLLSGSRAHRAFYGRMREAVSTAYAPQRTAGGWDFWCLKPL